MKIFITQGFGYNSQLIIVSRVGTLGDNQTGLKSRVRNENLIFLFLNQNICCGYSKEPSQ